MLNSTPAGYGFANSTWLLSPRLLATSLPRSTAVASFPKQPMPVYGTRGPRQGRLNGWLWCCWACLCMYVRCVVPLQSQQESLMRHNAPSQETAPNNLPSYPPHSTTQHNHRQRYNNGTLPDLKTPREPLDQHT